MPEPVAFITALIGIILLGLTFSAIDVIKGVGQLIGMALLAFLVILLVNRLSLSDTISDAPWNDLINSIDFGARARVGWQYLPYQITDPLLSNQPQFIRPDTPSPTPSPPLSRPFPTPPPSVSRPVTGLW